MEPMKKDLRISGQRVYLRPITADDTGLAVRWRNQKAVVENFIYRKEVTRADHEKWLVEKVFKGLVHQFVICGIEDDMPLGSVYLQNFAWEHKRAESGVYLGGEQMRGKGIGTEAVMLMEEYAFGTLGLHKLTARVPRRNFFWTANMRTWYCMGRSAPGDKEISVGYE